MPLGQSGTKPWRAQQLRRSGKKRNHSSSSSTVWAPEHLPPPPSHHGGAFVARARARRRRPDGNRAKLRATVAAFFRVPSTSLWFRRVCAAGARKCTASAAAPRALQNCILSSAHHLGARPLLGRRRRAAAALGVGDDEREVLLRGRSGCVLGVGGWVGGGAASASSGPR